MVLISKKVEILYPTLPISSMSMIKNGVIPTKNISCISIFSFHIGYFYEYLNAARRIVKKILHKNMLYCVSIFNTYVFKKSQT